MRKLEKTGQAVLEKKMLNYNTNSYMYVGQLQGITSGAQNVDCNYNVSLLLQYNFSH